MSFEVILILGALAAMGALLRLRPGTFILAANQVFLLRAFIHIRDHGQPASQDFLPPYLFRSDGLDVAANILAIPAAALLLSVALAPRPRAHPAGPAPVAAYPALHPAIVAMLALYFVAVILSSRTILDYGYVDERRQLYNLQLGGGHLFLVSLVIYEGYRRTSLGLTKGWIAFGIVMLLCTGTDFAKGSTGLAAGIVVTAAFLLLGLERARMRRYVLVAAALVAVVVVTLTVRAVRGSISELGTGALAAFTDELYQSETQVQQRGEGSERLANATQGAAHLLMCVALYESGRDRGWRSVTDAFEFTLKPSFLMKPLGIERSIDATWELASYFQHGGGINTWGELYWNGGYLAVAVLSALVIGFAYLCDTRYRRRRGWLLMACAFTPGLLQGFGYGFAQIARGAFNGLLLIALFAFAVRLAGLVRGARAAARPTASLPAGPAGPPAGAVIAPTRRS